MVPRAALAAVACFLALQSAANTQTGGRVSGRVFDEATGVGIAGVRITILNGDGSYVTDTVTDSVGNYLTSEIAFSGTFFARTSEAAPYVNELYGDYACLAYCPLVGASTFVVEVGTTTDDIDFPLAVGGFISGRITGEGVPINASAIVNNFDRNIVTNGDTDATGAYVTADALPPGTYWVYTMNSLGFADELYDGLNCSPYCDTTVGAHVVVAAGATTPDIDFNLERGGAVSVTVRGNAGMPLPNIHVFVESFTGYGWIIPTDANGVVRFDELASGAYRVRTVNSIDYLDELYDDVPCDFWCDPSLATLVAVTPGGDTPVSIVLNLSGPSGSITGSVASAGSPVAAFVELYDESGAWVTGLQTDASGLFEIPGIPIGAYFIRTSGSGYVDELYDDHQCLGYCDPTTGTPVAVADGATSVVTFDLGPAARISGAVTNESGVALPDVFIAVYDASGAWIMSVPTGQDGSYELLLAQAGSYFLEAANSAGYVNEVFDNFPCTGSCDVTGGTPINATLGGTASANFVLSLAPPVATLSAWGNGADSGAVGDGFFELRYTPWPVKNLTDVTAVAAGGFHSLAALNDGTVWAFGLNDSGQLGFEFTADTPTPDWTDEITSTPGQVEHAGDPSGFLTGVTDVAGGLEHSLALKTDGTVWAWGNNTQGQLGDGCAFLPAGPPPPPACTVSPTPTPISSSGTLFHAVAAGEWHSLALASDGRVFTWGDNGHGRLGHGCVGLITCMHDSTPKPIASLNNVIAIAGGATHSLALKSDGTVWAWGDNSRGELGTDGAPSASPVQVPGLTNVVAIEAGSALSVALKADGTVWTWGRNTSGELGNGTFSSDPSSGPTQVMAAGIPLVPLTDITAIGAGRGHVIALDADGHGWGWGQNSSGLLGDGTWIRRNAAVRVRHLAGAVDVDGGQDHTIALVTEAPDNLGAAAAEIGPEGGIVNTVASAPIDTLSVTVEVSQGALAAGTMISVEEIPATDPSQPSPPPNGLSHVFRLTPEGLTFSTPATLSFSYDEREIGGRDESTLTVSLVVGGSYVALGDCMDRSLPTPDPCVDRFDSDPSVNRITVKTSHFSVYGLSFGPPIPGNSPPVASAALNAAGQCEIPGGTRVTLDGSASFDPDGDPLIYTWIEGATILATTTEPVTSVLLGAGTHMIRLAVSDGRVSASTGSMTIQLDDSDPPVIGSATASPAILWPPNGRMVPVAIDVSASDACSGAEGVTCRIVGVEMNEASQQTSNWELTGPLSLNLRAQRGGAGGGRTYSILIECADSAGNVSTKTVAVSVPHDRGPQP